MNILVMGLDLMEKDFCSIGNEIGWNVIIFGVDMSLSVHVDNKKKQILILRKGPTQGLGEVCIIMEIKIMKIKMKMEINTVFV